MTDASVNVFKSLERFAGGKELRTPMYETEERRDGEANESLSMAYASVCTEGLEGGGALLTRAFLGFEGA